MYVKDTPVVISWNLITDQIGFTQDYYDIIIIDPVGVTTYLVDPFETYTAPNAVEGVPSPGLGTYTFTPTERGRWRLKLVTGTAAAYITLDYINFFVQCEAPVIAPPSIIQPATPYVLTKACPVAFYGNLVALDGSDPDTDVLDWRNIWGISQSPTNPDLLWILGTRTTLDDYPSIARVRISDATIIEYPDSVNMIGPYAGGYDDANNIAVGPGERLVVSKKTQNTNNEYDFYYSDPPYTNWTVCTTDDLNRFAGYSELTYDAYLGLWFACSSTRTFVSSDGIDWVTQRSDEHALSGSGTNSMITAQHQNMRVTTDSYSTLYFGSGARGSGEERFTQTIAEPADVPDPLPLASSICLYVDDIFGGSISSKKSQTIMRSPNSDRVIWVTNTHLISTNDGDPFTWDAASIVDLTILPGWSTSQIRYAFWWEGADNGAGRYYIYTSLNVWWESVDAVTWVVSTNTQLTAWTLVDINSGLGTGKFCIYKGAISGITLGGVAFVNNVDTLVIAKP